MDSQRFDAFVRAVAADVSRRSLLRAAAGAAVAALFGSRSVGAASCRGAGRLCSKPAHCCSGICDIDERGRKRCLCPDGAERCREACVDPAVGYLADPENCGACGVRCPSGVCRDGLCTKRRGEACADGGECASGFCIDGLCCESACDGQCESCADRGRCRAASGDPPAGRPPCAGNGDCAGACDGRSSGCVYPAADTTCADSTCDAGLQTDFTCDGAGACASATTDCGLYVCGAEACLTECGDDGDCLGSAYCDGGACTGDRATGEPCDRRDQCQSGFCVQGVCCASRSCPRCSACNVAGSEGACTQLADETVCGSDRICCDGTCCDAGATCEEATCTETCIPLGESCASFSECCWDEVSDCTLTIGYSRIDDFRCCNFVGQACARDQDCCSDPPFFVSCSPDGVCGGGGAVCTLPGQEDSCHIGVCCQHTALGNAFCCGENEDCTGPILGIGTCLPIAGAPCDSGADCARGLCCGGVCADRTEEHCAACDDVCAANASCVGGQCLKDFGQPCGSADECATGFCIGGLCCDECGGACGRPVADDTPCDRGGICCNGECLPDSTDDHCGACGHVCSGLANHCLGSECDCERASVCGPDGLDPDRCLGGLGFCAVSTEGVLACTDIRECGPSCSSTADCPTPAVCSTKWGGGLQCTSTWICSDSTCCGKTCHLVVPA